MILVLSGADGSNCGLGKIEIPAKMQDETLAILAKMTRYDEDAPQTTALNQFIYGLKNNGLWSKIGVFLPMFMCNSLDEMKYDAISDSALTLAQATDLSYDSTTHAINYSGNGSVYANTTPYLSISGKKIKDSFFVMSRGSDQYSFLTGDSIMSGLAFNMRYSGSPDGNTSLLYINVNNDTKYQVRDVSEKVTTGYCGLFNIISNPILSSKADGSVNATTITAYNDGDLSGLTDVSRFCFIITKNSPITLAKEFTIIGNTTLTDSEQTIMWELVSNLRTALDSIQ